MIQLKVLISILSDASQICLLALIKVMPRNLNFIGKTWHGSVFKEIFLSKGSMTANLTIDNNFGVLDISGKADLHAETLLNTDVSTFELMAEPIEDGLPSVIHMHELCTPKFLTPKFRIRKFRRRKLPTRNLGR